MMLKSVLTLALHSDTMQESVGCLLLKCLCSIESGLPQQVKLISSSYCKLSQSLRMWVFSGTKGEKKAVPI